MNRARLDADLLAEEGERLTVYRDTEGYLTCGRGHLVRPQDNLTLGQAVTEAQCLAWFEADVDTAIARAARLFGATWDTFPDEVQEIIVNMSYQLGNRLQLFLRWHDALMRHDYSKAAAEMQDSRWARQTPNRANRLMHRMMQVIPT